MVKWEDYLMFVGEEKSFIVKIFVMNVIVVYFGLFFFV